MRIPGINVISVVAGLLFAGTTAGFGQLTFAEPHKRFEKRSSDKLIEFSFPFRNDTNHPVTIRRVKTSCGCTTAKLEKKTYAPGESGEISTRFKFGHRTGKQVKGVTVSYDHEKVPDTQLVMEVVITPPVSVKPALVFWKAGSPAVPRTVEISTDKTLNLTVEAAEASTDDFRTELRDKGDGNFELTVIPAETKGRRSASIKIVAAPAGGGSGEKQTTQVYARVQ